MVEMDQLIKSASKVDMRKHGVKILIAEKSVIMGNGLGMFIQANFNCHDVVVVNNNLDLLIEVNKKEYSHLILDFILKDGDVVDAVASIRGMAPDLKLLFFTAQLPNVYKHVLQHFGVINFLEKSAEEPELMQALMTFLSSDQRGRKESDAQQQTNPFSLLTPRELKVLNLILKGLSTTKISEELNLKLSTISTYKKKIHIKTKTTNLRDLLELSIRNNLFS